MQNLQILVLKWNLLKSVTTNPSSLFRSLKYIDLSGTHLGVFDSKALSWASGVQFINISFSSMQSLDPQGFQMASRLKELDIRGTTVNYFPPDLFQGLTQMEKIYASFYKLCCKEILPKVIPQPRCLAPPTSSVFLW